MAHALELYFDAAADAAVRDLWRAVDSPLLAAGARPHVSLAVADVCDCDALRTALDLTRIHNIEITMESLAVLREPEPLVYLAVPKSPRLAALQEDVWHHFTIRATNPRSYYSPHHWVPYCAIAYGVDHVDVTLGKRLPIHAHVIEIGLADVTRTKSTPIWTEKTGS